MSLKKKIFLNISEIASFIGQNKYDFITPFERIWKKCDLENYTKCLNNLKSNLNEINTSLYILQTEKNSIENDLQNKKITKRQYNSLLKNLNDKEINTKNTINSLTKKIDSIHLTQEQRIEKTLGKEFIQNINENINKITKENKLEINNQKINSQNLIKDLDLESDERNDLIKETESFINKTHGTLKENDAIKMFEKKFKVKLDTSQIYNKKCLEKLSINSKFEWYIGGKVDGLYIDSSSSKNSYVVEVKNRTKSFFNTLRDYESTQIQLYMWLLNLPQARLVEKLNNKIKVTQIFYNEDYINEILDYLQIFITEFENKFLDKENKKLEFLNCDSQNQKQLFIKKLYLSKIEKLKNKNDEIKFLQEESKCLIDDLD